MENEIITQKIKEILPLLEGLSYIEIKEIIVAIDHKSKEMCALKIESNF